MSTLWCPSDAIVSQHQSARLRLTRCPPGTPGPAIHGATAAIRGSGTSIFSTMTTPVRLCRRLPSANSATERPDLHVVERSASPRSPTARATRWSSASTATAGWRGRATRSFTSGGIPVITRHADLHLLSGQQRHQVRILANRRRSEEYFPRSSASFHPGGANFGMMRRLGEVHQGLGAVAALQPV